MGWLRLVGSLKLYVSFAKEPYKRDLYYKRDLHHCYFWIYVCVYHCGAFSRLASFLRNITRTKCVWMFIYKCMFRYHVNVKLHVPICCYTHMCIYIYMRTRICPYNMCTYIYLYIYKYLHTHMIYMYIYTNINIHISTYTHACIKSTYISMGWLRLVGSLKS